jgi:hypothetical protein
LDPEVPYSESAVELLMLTAAAESELGRYIVQVGGPARGIFRMEPETQYDIYINYLVYHEGLLHKVNSFASDANRYELDSVGNIPFQIVYARVYYLRVAERLPEIHYLRVDPEKGGTQRILTVRTMHALAKYWKRYYNTPKGKGTVDGAVQKYRRFVNES